MIFYRKKSAALRSVWAHPFIFILTFLVVICCCCSRPAAELIDREIFIPVKDNQLYVRLSGNARGPIIVMLHGGPGGSSGFDREFYKEPMEGTYLMAYLDQRGCGKSPAEENDHLITMDQFVADLDVVIDTLRHQYPDQPIHLLGASWGGTYGFLYLLKHQDKVRSFICVSGKIDGLYENKVLIAHEMDLVQKKLAALKDPHTPEGDTLRQIARELDRIQGSDFEQFFKDVELLKFKFPEKLGFNPYWYDTAAQHKAMRLGKDSSFYVRAHYDIASYDSVNVKGTHVNKVFRNTPAYNQIQLADQLSQIKIPISVVGGAEDYVVGPGHARLIYNALTGLGREQKELHILAGAAHNVNLEAEQQYYPIIKAFLAKQP